jgi:hypothetical protein
MLLTTLEGETNMRATILIAAAAVALTGCASTIGKMRGETAAQRYTEYAGEPIDRFTAFDINGWTPVSRNKLVVWTGVNDAYLLTVWDNCRDLQFADRVAVTQTGRSVSKFETVPDQRDSQDRHQTDEGRSRRGDGCCARRKVRL